MTDLILQKMSKAKVQLLSENPFLSSILLSLRFVEATAEEGIKTMATDGKWLWWNREFVDKLSMLELKGVLVHEAAHVVLKHMLRQGERHHEKWNHATDYAINLIIDAQSAMAQYILPEGVLRDSTYKGMTAEQIYDRLPDDGGKGGGGGEGNGEGGYVSIGEVFPATNDDGTPLSPAEAEMMEHEVNSKVITAAEMAKRAGKLPANVEGYVNQLREPQVDWRSKLRRAVLGNNPDDYSLRRASRKFLSYGHYLPGVEKTGVGRIVCAIDTSGSVSDAEMSAFWSEVVGICEETHPEEVVVIHCDASIQHVETFHAGEVPQLGEIKRHGRGGTRFEPPFNYVEENLADPDTFLYLTDGQAGFPDQPRYPVTWVVSTNSITAPWGETVHINK